MSGIQTAAIGGLGAFVYKAEESQASYGPGERGLLVAAFMLLAVALLTSAWLLSSVASISLRLYSFSKERASEAFDIYNQPSFTWAIGRSVPLGILMGVQHWAWALGLGALAIFGLIHFGT